MSTVCTHINATIFIRGNPRGVKSDDFGGGQKFLLTAIDFLALLHKENKLRQVYLVAEGNMC